MSELRPTTEQPQNPTLRRTTRALRTALAASLLTLATTLPAFASPFTDGGGFIENPTSPQAGELIPGAELVRDANGIHVEAHVACGTDGTLRDGTKIKDIAELAFRAKGRKGLTLVRLEEIPLSRGVAFPREVTWTVDSGDTIQAYATGVVGNARNLGQRDEVGRVTVQAGSAYLLEVHDVTGQSSENLRLSAHPDAVGIVLPDCPSPEAIKMKNELEAVGVGHVEDIQKVSKNSGVQFEFTASPSHQLMDSPVEKTGNFVDQMFSADDVIRISPDQKDRENYVVITKDDAGQIRTWFVAKTQGEISVEVTKDGQKTVRQYPQERFPYKMTAILLEGQSEYQGKDQPSVKAHLIP